MSSTIKNPAPFADGDRASKLVKVRNPDNQDTTPNTKARQRVVLDVAVSENGKERFFTVRGQTAKALWALIGAGSRGCTALEAASWAYRFAAYCHDLIHKHGLVIRTDKEPHEGGWHGRHVLVSNVRICDVR
jgi:hypothetical protein